MVYVEATKKTGAYLLIAAVLGLGVATFLTEDLASPTGMVVSPASEVIGSNWLVFALGTFIGALLIGTYAYVVHFEGKRDE